MSSPGRGEADTPSPGDDGDGGVEAYGGADGEAARAEDDAR